MTPNGVNLSFLFLSLLLIYRLDMLRQQNPSDVDVAITPEELEGLDEASIQALYNQRVADERARNAREVKSCVARVFGVVSFQGWLRGLLFWGAVWGLCLIGLSLHKRVAGGQ